MIKHYFFYKEYFSHDLLKKALEIFCCGKNPFLYLLSGAIPLIGGLALYINSLKDDTIDELKIDLKIV